MSSDVTLFFLLLQAICLTASPTPPPALSKRAGAFPDFPVDYDGRVKKGEYLRTLMPVDNAGAAAANGGASVFLSEAVGDSAFPVDEKNGAVYYYDYDKEFKQADGEMGQPSLGSYSNVVNPAAGALIFDVNMSPTYAVKEYGLGAVPDMDMLSDFAFFQWLLGCQAKKVDPKSLKVVFRAHITYGPTYNLVLQALKDAGQKRVPGWSDRATFKMGTREGDAILGSTHGAGTAWMLIQHEDVLGVKEITEAVVWGMVQPKSLADTPGPAEGFEFDADRGPSVLSIRFTIKDA
ncbi:hypothetical protein CGCVW01_v006511 [Colletotrichum viniferum]|nr:hypothetical protein CGCVW01_v006511 [Colletotrichum viniferum]